MDAVDPRFARWFGRQVVLHAQDQERSFVQKVRLKQLEYWTKFKVNAYHVMFVLFPFTCGEAIKLLFKWTLFASSVFSLFAFLCIQLFLLLVFGFLPIILFAPVLALACPYRNQTLDVCCAVDVNYTLPFSQNETKHHILIDAEFVYRFEQALHMCAVLIDFAWLLLKQIEMTKSIPDLDIACEFLNKYHIFR